MPTPLASPLLRIDDAEADLGSVWVHAQDDPYPGGHRYRLWLPEPSTAWWLDATGDLLGLGTALAHWRREGGTRSSGTGVFVLNTIEAVARADGGVEVQGECSPHCSTLGCPSCGTTLWVNWLFDYCARGAGGRVTFRCKECSAWSEVALDGRRVSLSSPDGLRISSCTQAALQHECRDGALQIRLGKLQWKL